MMNSFYSLDCPSGQPFLYENGLTRWFPRYQNGITLARNTAAVMSAQSLKGLAKWEIRARFEYNNKPGTACGNLDIKLIHFA